VGICDPDSVLLGSKDDQTAGWIIGRDGNSDSVTENDADTIASHPAGKLRQHPMTPGNLYAEVSACGNLDDIAFELYVVIPTHQASLQRARTERGHFYTRN
jgi:hypothetical protein